MSFEYLDHPADVILHSWGQNIIEAFENAAAGMFNFMSDLTKVEEKEIKKISIDATSYEEALVKFLDSWLCIFSSELFIGKSFKCEVFDDNDEENIHIECKGIGEYFVIGKHQQGTEIKAITWHNLEIYDDEKDQTHIHILLDI
ncbi:archease [Entamoeba histolytica HM-3:IMSS]|uniref:Protein archease-like n=7 Tax=Entamoeba TaxID=5758 RepID=C4MB82_ENTH1|nr:hypothetical protein, conserved [Entamoeba histolytica HM-1:IMSS]EMD42964.1 archease, putative [Entamoeba histolytica KU27]EMS15136.1 archease [Entamoeba histolytica HM-3:IMSS]ENY65092.1 archease, putative [Entamoeba histolytica HM-1:IMSS-A]GAT99193.1 hypothetical protein conserved [Entamoeba histolytica]EAL49542.2 hypothetical protein, conserved [Entamoeba histolytica HM-1:IMSS]|eukprot:XP_654928.2 hypothetical protein, conserved [Entamoeba histolytica HM-1:IMSS]